MCTVSFIARQRGYLLAMNRDEQLSRVQALPPNIISAGNRRLICPSEPSGGTWIVTNETGVTFALINWYAVKARVQINPVSRGEVVNAVRIQAEASTTLEILPGLALKRINPFRLIGIFPATKEVIEWRWNLKQLASRKHPWQAQQFISSGFDEPKAQRIRSEVFRQVQRQKSSGTLDWLCRLHRSHGPARGPFSTCMHRTDAATVSYTEVAVSLREAKMRYHAGPPCQEAKDFVRALKLSN